MFSLLRRIVLGERVNHDRWLTDIEMGELVDGTNLGEMDCRWSPTMGMPPADFEETRPHGMPLNAPSGR